MSEPKWLVTKRNLFLSVTKQTGNGFALFSVVLEGPHKADVNLGQEPTFEVEVSLHPPHMSLAEFNIDFALRKEALRLGELLRNHVRTLYDLKYLRVVDAMEGIPEPIIFYHRVAWQGDRSCYELQMPRENWKAM